MILYLLLMDVQNTILAAILTLSDRLVYPAYATVPGQVAALEDPGDRGAGHVAARVAGFLVAAMWLAVELVDGGRYAVMHPSRSS